MILLMSKFVTSSVPVLEAAIWIKYVYMAKSKKHKRRKSNKFRHDFSPKRTIYMSQLHGFLRRSDARWSADIIYFN